MACFCTGKCREIGYCPNNVTGPPWSVAPTKPEVFNPEAALWKASYESAMKRLALMEHERDRAVETRENANAVSGRLEQAIKLAYRQLSNASYEHNKAHNIEWMERASDTLRDAVFSRTVPKDA